MSLGPLAIPAPTIALPSPSFADRYQLGAVLAMIEDGRDCRDIVTQLSAASSAIDRAGFAIIASAMKECLREGENGGDPVEVAGSNMLARAIQHETDHLDGILFIDRLDPEAQRAALEAIQAAEWYDATQPPAVQLSPHATGGLGR